MGLFDKLFNSDKKILAEVERATVPVDQLKDQMAALSDEQLKHKTVEFKERLANGETLDDIQAEAFAVAREAAKRVIGEFPFFCQLEGAYVLHRGDIAEMKTGEGKTLTSVMAVYLNALEGKGVHVVTVNEYLAQRDSEWMGQIHRFLGLTVGLNLRALTPAQKRAAYECDITYTTNSEVGFDYLRDNMVTRVEDRVLRELNFALVDEVDSILIDESRTPLIISGGEKKTANLYINADRFVKRLKKDEDYVIDVKDKNVQLTEEGVHKGEKAFNVENLYDLDNTSLVHYIAQALKANYIMTRDVEYVVEDNEVIIVDQNTGRKMPGREYSDGLHQAIQAKEGVPIKQETTTWATITYQNFFRLYNKLAGMTGTAKTEEEEFLSIYNMRVVEIPTNKPVARIDYPDLVFGTKKAKYNALLEEVKELYAKGQPVLVGTISVETSELISRMFKQARIKHEVLNAKNHAREAEIIAKAGREGSVTIATNMAGRGTDIKLTERSRELGGLVVLGSERHESRRIDNQLRGRSGRQGDPGYSRFYVSLEDELMVRFGSERIAGLFEQMGDIPIENKTVSKAISSAQKRVEGLNFDIRKALLDYDDVMRQQRETMYAQRNYILENEDIHSVVENMFERVIENIVDSNTNTEGKKEVIDYESIAKRLNTMGQTSFTASEIEGLDRQATIEKCKNVAFNAYEDKIRPVKNQIMPVERTMVLRLMDRAWQNQIDVMSKLREGIHLRSYAQNNPLQAYVEEGYELFESMMNTISSDVVTFCNNLKIVIKEK
ncbi:MAG: preprotein translocase subunit SecA [Erysipelotrichaceae bacterium]|nr:preprotein translocase subunit SecA [Erysipelotrichaceae bacterium]MBQ2505736.1 preprotein translocase subunit SecA [Erysipelotrichaceae bacterium]